MPSGIFGGMGEEQRPLTVYQSVRCLECGAVYSKPERGGTLEANPGCPECGYVGWLPLNVPVARLGALQPRR
jgi:predicted RNA-binding Zn-ribbon protein involved in translation (DUF1610 family)